MAQAQPDSTTRPAAPPLALSNIEDYQAPVDSLDQESDSTEFSGSFGPVSAGAPETTVEYTAEDSIYMDVVRQVTYLYGNATVTYGDIKLEADEIELDMATNTVTAKPSTDSTGQIVGRPLFVDGDDEYLTDEIRYNFQSKRAIITGVVTQQNDGFVFGDRVRKNEDNDLFIEDGKFCPCEDPNADTFIKAKRIKMIPNDKVVTGPFLLYISDLPTPFGFVFGMFPAPRKQANGILFPTYGEERRRGFFIRDGGYFTSLGEYANLAVTGEVYSRGSRGVQARSQYTKRYRYSGNVSLRYNSTRISDDVEDSTRQNDFWINWNHSPQSYRNSRFSAQVSAGTTTFNGNNVTNIATNQQQEFSSSVNYSKTFVGTPLNMTASMRHAQNVATNRVELTFPEMAFNMNRIFPFKSGSGSGDTWYEKINFAARMNVRNRVSNQLDRTLFEGPEATGDTIAPFNFQTLDLLLQEAQNGAQWNVPISTSFNVLKHFTVTPSFNFNSRMHFREFSPRWDPTAGDDGAVVYDTLNQVNFNYDYSSSVGATTRLYGTVVFGRDSKVQAIRHVLTPSISMSYRPDFSRPALGFYEEIQASEDPTDLRRFSRYQGLAYGGPGQGESGSVNFSLGNNLEMKVLDRKDSTDEFATKKITIFDQLSVSSGYNFLGDQFRLSNFNMSARTRIFNDKVDINTNATLDPYLYEQVGTEDNIRGQRVDIYSWQAGQGIGRISTARLALSTNLSPQARERDKERDDLANETTGINPLLDPNNTEAFLGDSGVPLNVSNNGYIDFDIPWSLRVSYNLNYRNRPFEENDVTQAVNFSGDLSLSDKWKIAFNSGYNFEDKQLTQTNLNINRDLGCWVMSFNWVPFGFFESYSFTIRIKAPMLSDLKVDRNRSFFDRR